MEYIQRSMIETCRSLIKYARIVILIFLAASIALIIVEKESHVIGGNCLTILTLILCIIYFIVDMSCLLVGIMQRKRFMKYKDKVSKVDQKALMQCHKEIIENQTISSEGSFVIIAFLFVIAIMLLFSLRLIL